MSEKQYAKYEDLKDKLELSRERRKELHKEMRLLEESHEKQIRKLDRQHSKEKEELQALRELHLNSLQQAKTAIELQAKSSILEAKNDEFDSLVKEIAKANEKAEKVREEGEKKGYADGVADGLREATKITADDRKMMGQIAALAAASHQGDASKQIADAIAKDMHNVLPATTKKQ